MIPEPATIEVAVALPTHGTFTYKVSPDLQAFVKIGQPLLVPFGQRRVTGYVLGPAADSGPENLKAVLEILDESPLFAPAMVPFFRWISEYYLHPLGQVIKAALPGGINMTARRIGPKQVRFVSLADPLSPDETAGIRLTEPRQQILDILKSEGPLPLSLLSRRIRSAPRLVKALAQGGYLKIVKQDVYRDPFGETIAADTPLRLTPEQITVVTEVLNRLQKGFCPYLLAGVTGSGKTEVYLHLAAEVIRRGRSVLVLVPEIALISQTERRFRARFGDCVAVLHSGLSQGERYDQWLRIRRNTAAIAIGARSALFAPFDTLGLIIVDEEHDPSYKQDSQLRYNARDLALVRARMAECPIILGSATPSIQSYHNAETGKYRVLTLSRRVAERPLPQIEIVDLRKARDQRGIRRFISPELGRAMQQTLERGEQVLLFLNRRGFASLPLCAACGEALRCKNCDLALTFHKGANAYKCHYCGFSQAGVSTCSHCGSDRIQRLGLGTEKVTEAVQSIFEKAAVVRMDRDTTRHKGSLLKILKDLKIGAIDILVGTQIVAKGHDFPNITLVGIICADMSLNFPDFRAAEQTFQLLAQVAGRAGRGDRPGQVILQTYNPEHFSILAAQRQDMRAFYEQEIRFRQALNYPPFSRMIQMTFAGKDPHETEAHARKIGTACRALKQRSKPFLKGVEILGPIEAPLARIARNFRWQILLKGTSATLLHRFVRTLMTENSTLFDARSVKSIVDVDPVFMM